VKTCPVCKVAMVCRVKDDETTLYECLLCKTEIATRQPVNKRTPDEISRTQTFH
jgi:DNA-directed RNA polymerase subunit M/transcription elongation factor TFIIS